MNKEQPEPRKYHCPMGYTPDNCPHMRETYSDMNGERYRCDKPECGESYWLDYDEMK